MICLAVLLRNSDTIAALGGPNGGMVEGGYHAVVDRLVACRAIVACVDCIKSSYEDVITDGFEGLTEVIDNGAACLLVAR